MGPQGRQLLIARFRGRPTWRSHVLLWSLGLTFPAVFITQSLPALVIGPGAKFMDLFEPWPR